ncbi:MAG: hypothetical protein Q9216_006373 [Gyalolechia sp. 2 TL-2023]
MIQLLVILAAVATIVATAVGHDGHTVRRFEAQTGRRDRTFDYVVVGGGTAGLALASRLAQGGSLSVAVIEAGGFYEQDNGNLSVVPAYCTFNSGTDPTDVNPAVDWGFVTEPQKGLDGRRLHYTRGKTLGGTSARNYLYYQRPSIESLDIWAGQVGDDSYKFANLLPFYKKSVHYTPPVVPFTNSTNDQDPDAWSATGGPLQASYGKFVDPFGTWVQPAAETLGIPTINGFQSGRLLGNAYVPFTIDPKNGYRSSSESSFLQSLPRQARLRVFYRTLAEKILLDENNKATGVSNALRYDIPLRIDLPGVGFNLQDHPWFGTQYRVLVPTASALLNNASLFALARQDFDSSAAGPLTIPTTGFLAWEKVPDHLRQTLTPNTRYALDSRIPSDWPELEHLPVNAALGYQRNYQKEDPVDGYNYATIGTLLAAPFSRGTVSISSANPADPPLIDPAYLTDPADVELAIVAIRRQREFWAQMQGVVIGKETLPGEDVESDEEILKFVKASLAPAPHASGTCRMGIEGIPGNVVDNLGRVYGARGLRVVDASVFPVLPPGHPQATIYALAEKIADAILKGK